MRKILLLTFFILGAISNSFAQLTQDFEGAFPPAGWTINSTNATYTWVAEEFGIDGQSASVEYDANQDESLISPVFTVPAGTPFLKFDLAMSYYYSIDPNDSYNFLVSISSDGGTTWTEIWDETDFGVFDDYDTLNIVIPLTAYAGQTNVKLKFQYVGDDGDNLYLDNVEVLVPPGSCLDANYGQYPVDSFTPECAGVPEEILDNAYAGEYSIVNVTAGTEYVFSSSVATDFITISSDDGATAAIYGITPVTWTAAANGEVRFYTHANNLCGSQQSNRSRFVKCGIQTIFPPSCSVLVYPANGATNITAINPIVLSWNAPTTGDAPTSYDLYIGFAPGDLNLFDTYTTTQTDPIPVGEYGLTIYWQVIPKNIAGEAVGCSEFSFTTEPAPAAPVNDDCAGAVALIAGSDFEENAVDGTIISATTDADVIPSCQANLAADVWYTAVIPASGSLTIETQSGDDFGLEDSIITAFSGTCGSLTEIGCNDDIEVGTNNMSRLVLTGQTPGLIYIGVWKYGTDDADPLENTFRISAFDASLSNNHFNLSSFRAYPNPVKDILNLECDLEMNAVKIVNVLGQEVISRSVNANNAAIDMSSLTKGIYIVTITSGDNVKSLKVVKQ